MKLYFKYNRYGYLTPYLIEKERIVELSDQYTNKQVGGYDCQIEKHTGRIYLTTPKHEAISPAAFAELLTHLQNINFITADEKQKFIVDYQNQYDILPHLSRNKENYNYDLDQLAGNFYEENLADDNYNKDIFWLETLKQKYNQTEFSEYDIAKEFEPSSQHFKILHTASEIRGSQQIPNQEQTVTEIGDSAKNQPAPATHLPENSKLSDWLEQNFFQLEMDESSRKIFNSAITNAIDKVTEIKPLAQVAALWTMLGIDNIYNFENTNFREYLRTVEAQANSALQTYFKACYQHTTQTIYLTKVVDATVSSNFFHELTHAIGALLNWTGEIFSDFLPEKLTLEKLSREILQLLNKIPGSTAAELLNYRRYPETAHTTELGARWTELKFQTQTEIPEEIAKNIEQIWQQFLEDAKNWCENFIDETGLLLLPSIRKQGFFTNSDQLSLSAEEINFLQEAKKQQLTLLDLIIRNGIENSVSTENIIKHFSQPENGSISPYAFLLAAARSNHVELATYLFENCSFNRNDPRVAKALIIATQQEHREMVNLFIKEKISLSRSFDQVTALHWAAANNSALAELLLKNGADCKAKDGSGRTPIYLAIKKGHTSLVKLFLAHDITLLNDIAALNIAKDLSMTKYLVEQASIDIHKADPNRNTALHSAAANNRLDIAEYLINKNCEINARNKFRQTPLYFAVRTGNLAMVELLLKQKNLEINCPDQSGISPFLLAVASNQNQVARLLLATGQVKINHQLANGKTALYIAIEQENLELLKLILLEKDIDPTIKNLAGKTAIELALEKKNTEIKKLLVNRFPDLDIENNNGWLHCAVNNNDRAFVQYLLTSPIDVNRRGENQATALHQATALYSSDIFEMLLKHEKTLVTLSDIHGDIPLHYAANNGYATRCKRLLQKNESYINFSNKQQQTPLHLACMNGHAIVIKELLQIKKVDLDPIDENGNHPLHLAINKEACAILLLQQNGLDINATNKSGETVLHRAIKTGSLKTLEKLLQYPKIDLKKADQNGETPLVIAEKNRPEVVKLLEAALMSNQYSKNPQGFWPNTEIKEAENAPQFHVNLKK